MLVYVQLIYVGYYAVHLCIEWCKDHITMSLNPRDFLGYMLYFVLQ
jgi:hypothetical protein